MGRDGETVSGELTHDVGINFQKASCTLDGCVKIWTSRVDSVATETGKLLSGLAGGGKWRESCLCFHLYVFDAILMLFRRSRRRRGGR